MDRTEALLRTLPDRIAPAHTALLVIDVQNDFCAKGGYVDAVMGRDVSGSVAVAEAIGSLVEVARRAGVYIVWVKAVYDPKYQSAPMLAKRDEMGLDHAVCCAEDGWGADWFMIAPGAGEPELKKHRYSAFVGTPLEGLLRRRGIRSLVVTGVATNICIDSTLRDGFLRDYYIAVPGDCVGSANQELHEATLKNVAFLFGDLTTGAELAALWDAAAGHRPSPPRSTRPTVSSRPTGKSADG